MLIPLCWFLIVGVLTSRADVKFTTKNQVNPEDGGVVKEDKSTPQYLDDILNSDYFEEKVTPTNVFSDEERQPVVEDEVVVQKASNCLGCPITVDPYNPKIKEIALFAFGEYAKGVQDDQVQKFVRVAKAESQVVAGIKYNLKVEIGWTTCRKSQNELNEPESCQLDDRRPTFTCDFQVIEKSWEKTKEVINVDCEKEDNVSDDIIDEEDTTETPNTINRRKRDVMQFTRKGNFDEIVKFAIQQMDSSDEDENARLVVDVLRVKQTLTGEYNLKLRTAQTTCKETESNTLDKCKYKIQLPFEICDVQIQVDKEKKLVSSKCKPEKLKKSKKFLKKLRRNEVLEEQTQSPTSRPLIGGNKEIDPNSDDILELTTFAIDSLDEVSNALHAQKLVRVISARRQVVSGVLTKLEVEIGYTTCRKSPTIIKSACNIDENREHQYCNLTVVEKPWLKEKKLTQFKCGKLDQSNPKIQKRERRETGEIDSEHEGFEKFIKTYEKDYQTEEEYQHRLGVYKENMKKVKVLQEYEQGSAVYGATVFADLTEEEFSKRHLGLRQDLRRYSIKKQAKIPQLPRIPEEFDWRHYNAVTPVKNQGYCGSCWAFSVSGNIEGAYAIKHGALESFSEQELVDCDTLDEGCNGGLPENAYKILQKLGGLETEQEYPYEGKDEKCHFNSKLAKAKLSGFVEVSKNETEMAAWLVKNGPISIGINANAMQFYFGGVSHPWKFICSPKSLDHGVLIVGFGVYTTKYTHKTLPYWIVKNSWGPSWGEKGYYRVFRGDGTCGVNQMATSALIM